MDSALTLIGALHLGNLEKGRHEVFQNYAMLFYTSHDVFYVVFEPPLSGTKLLSQAQK